jgi:CRP-like cAMP-binding protein
MIRVALAPFGVSSMFTTFVPMLAVSFGEDALIFPEISRHYNAICITDAEVLKVDAQQVSKNLKTKAETAHMFIAYLLKRNRAPQEHLANCLLDQQAERLGIDKCKLMRFRAQARDS